MKNVTNIFYNIRNNFLGSTNVTPNNNFKTLLLRKKKTISKRDYGLHKNWLDQSVSNYTIVFIIIEIYY